MELCNRAPGSPANQRTITLTNGTIDSRSLMDLADGWWVSTSPDDAEDSARNEAACQKTDDIENSPVRVSLVSGLMLGKRPLNPQENEVTYGWITHDKDGKRLPHPFLSYAQKISIPDEWQGRSIFLLLDNARYYVDVYLNGELIEHYVGGLEPHRLEVTRHLVPGKEALLRITVGNSGVSGHRAFDVHNYTGTRLPTCQEIENNLIHPVQYGGVDRGIGSVKLEALPAIRTEWVFANPSLSLGRIELAVDLKNDSAAPVTLEVKSTALDEAGESKVLLNRSVTLPAHSEKKLTETTLWPDAILWDLETPHLYRLETSLSTDSGMVDRHEDTFGFREFSINGSQFYLNGKKIHLHGQSGHVQPYYDALNLEEKIQFFRDWKALGNVNHVRLHKKPLDKSWVIAADRAGMLITTETALWTTGYHSFDWVGSEEACYQNISQHFLNALVRRDRNNPSVIIWSLTNEMSPITPYDLENPKMAAMGRVLERVIQDAEAEDRSRVIQMSSAMDFLGNLRMYNLHYPKSWQAFPDYPHTAYWLEKPFAFPWYGDARKKMASWTWKREKPLFFGEFTCVFGATPDWQSCIVGEAAFEAPDGGSALVQEKLWPLEIHAYRRLDVSGFCAWVAMFVHSPESVKVRDWVRHPDVAALVKSQRALAALDHGYRTRFFAGDAVPLEISLHNDTRSPHHLTFSLKALVENQTIWSETSPSARFDCGDLRPFVSYFRIPESAPNSKLTIQATLTSEDQTVDAWVKTLSVWPRRANRSLSEHCVIFDPSGRLRRQAESRGLDARFISDRKELLASLPNIRVLWLNFPDSGMHLDDWKAIFRKVSAWVRQGGCVILDEPPDEVLNAMPVSIRNGAGFTDDQRLEITQAFIATPHHPVIAGLSNEHFSLWGNDYYLARRCWETPQEGNSRALLVAGADRSGLTFSPLLELREGTGSWILSSLEAWKKLNDEPLSLDVIHNLAAYEPAWKTNQSAAICGKGKWTTRLREVGWLGKPVKLSDALAADASLIDGSKLETLVLNDILIAASEERTVCLHGLSEEMLREIFQRLEISAKVESGVSSDETDTIQHINSLTDGMLNNHLYWTIQAHKLAAWSPATRHPQPATAKVSLSDPSRAVAHTQYGALITIQLGSGLLVLDNVRWEDTLLDEPERARRYLVTLLTNLGFPLKRGHDRSGNNLFETEAERRERGHF